MSLLKKIVKNPSFIEGGARIIAAYMRWVYRTTQWAWQGYNHIETLDQPAIIAFWHNRLLMMNFVWQKKTQPFHMMISSHADGLLIARTIAQFGLKTIYGSTNRNGIKALKEMIRHLQTGHFVGITPDGPRGPRYEAQGGIARVAQKLDIPIIPMAFSTQGREVLASRDRLVVPFPYSKGVYVIGTPLFLSKDLQADEALKLVNQALMKVTNQAEQLCGHPAEDACS